MDIRKLQLVAKAIKEEIESAVTTASYKGVKYEDGLAAKTALIRSVTLIQRIHELTKQSLHSELNRRRIQHALFPPLGAPSPEKHVWGFLKKKKQDLVVLVGDKQPQREMIMEGPIANTHDELGLEATKHSIVIGVRSQLSSINKNFDTLMERAFAETINLRLRHPFLVMGEVYLLAVREYDEQAMKRNQIKWKSQFTNVERFISIFNGISHRSDYSDIKQYYKYERSALLLVDFYKDPPQVYTTIDEMKQDGIVRNDYDGDYQGLSPLNFELDIINSYMYRHELFDAKDFIDIRHGDSK